MKLTADEMVKCPQCHGCGYQECVAYYYGRVECSCCQGSGVVKTNGEPFASIEELEASAVAKRE